jgi:DNA polymerase III subunit alpha
MSEFCHLHCHTHYSLLDGAAGTKKLARRAKDLGIGAVAITDHGNLFGVPSFYKDAKDAGVQPIIGCEFYVTPAGMADRSDKTRYHQVLLAKNETGYRNLCKLASLAYTEGYYYKARIDKDALRRYSEGLVATTCCLQGEVLQTILKRGEEAARPVFEQYLDIFGEDYYVEIQDHGIPEQKRCNDVLLRWATEYGVKVIATNDVHYVDRADAEAQDVLLCLQTGKDRSDPNRMRFENDQFFLKSPAEMLAAFEDLPRLVAETALANTREVADKCAFELPMGRLLMPHFPLPEGFSDADAYLRHLTFEGARRRWPEMPQHVVERLDFELRVIATMGFAGYFLIVQDFTTAARTLGVSVGPGRGSAAGSAVAYCLGITNIDPLQYDLLFERFLNPERVSMPDIDIDFDDRGRGKVIDYVVNKYGRANVCQIVTFGTMGAKTALRDVARVLQIPLNEADRIAKLVPDGAKVNFESAVKDVAEFRALFDDPNPQVRQLMHFAQVLEGSARHTGVHAAGVIIAPGDVSEYVPVQVVKSKGGEAVTTQYDGSHIESFGLLKMDFLGLKTLTVLDDALRLIRENHGVEIDLDAIPLDDEKTFRLFQRGETVAVFQFESSGMREYMVKLKPTCVDDLIAMNALYRPGPMDLIPTYIARKHGREPVEYPHAMLEPILAPTYGIPVYQEQVMQMAQTMGGYTLGGADLLRRAMGKKDAAKMAREREKFVAGAAQNGVDAKKATEVFDMMEKFAGYGFNKSHSAAYSLVAYQTAYLKANYTPEFMAAAMTNEMGDTDRLAVVLDEARALGIEMLPPCINHSQAHFSVEGGKVRFGLGAIKGVGLGAIEHLVAVRAKKGAFKSLFGLVRELDLRVMNKKALESLTLAGALDALDGHRGALAAALDAAVAYAQRHQAEQAAGMISLFGGGGPAGASPEPVLPLCEPMPRAEALKHERDLLGFYVSGHPLDAFALEVRAFASHRLGDVAANPPEVPEHSGDGFQRDRGPSYRFCGLITAVQRRISKTGKPMAFATLEDYTGQAEVVFFSRELDRCQAYLNVDEAVLVKGNVEVRGGAVKVTAQDLLPMWKVRELIREIRVAVDLNEATPAQMAELLALCDAHRDGGTARLYFDMKGGPLRAPLTVRSRKYVLAPEPALLQGLTKLFGLHAVTIAEEL